MGLDIDLRPVGTFMYRAEDPVSGLVEHEYDHVLVGTTEKDPDPDPTEADDWGWVLPSDLTHRLRSEPARFAPWLVEALTALPTLRSPGDFESS